jgi:hypothetical protein
VLPRDPLARGVGTRNTRPYIYMFMYYNLHMFPSVYMCLYVFILICLYIVFVYIYIYNYIYICLPDTPCRYEFIFIFTCMCSVHNTLIFLRAWNLHVHRRKRQHRGVLAYMSRLVILKSWSRIFPNKNYLISSTYWLLFIGGNLYDYLLINAPFVDGQNYLSRWFLVGSPESLPW